MASEVDVVDALRECAEAWEPDVCVLGNVQARDVVAVCERLRAAEAERDATEKERADLEDSLGQLRLEKDDADAYVRSLSEALHARLEEAKAATARAEQAEKERDQARERESYALDAIERNDERHAEAIRAVRQRAERAEQTRDAHAEALALRLREAGDLLDRIAALTVERDDARSLLAHAERAIEQGTGDCLLVDHLKRALMERDEARAALIRSQEDHRAAVEALETYEERIGDIADHVLGLVPPDVPSIVKLDAIERRCGEERVTARQAERERDEARAHHDYAAWRVQYDAAVAATSRAEAAEARLAKLEAEYARLLNIATDARIDQTQLRAIADAAAALRRFMRYERTDLVFRPRGSASAVCDAIAACDALDTALAARGEDGGA